MHSQGAIGTSQDVVAGFSQRAVDDVIRGIFTGHEPLVGGVFEAIEAAVRELQLAGRSGNGNLNLRALLVKTLARRISRLRSVSRSARRATSAVRSE